MYSFIFADADKLLKLKQAMGEKDKSSAAKSEKGGDEDEENGEGFVVTKQRKGFLNRLLRLGKPLDETTVLSFKKVPPLPHGL